ncbi:hypothetical protein RUND412_011640 [Rhizina undulata]
MDVMSISLLLSRFRSMARALLAERIRTTIEINFPQDRERVSISTKALRMLTEENGRLQKILWKKRDEVKAWKEIALHTNPGATPSRQDPWDLPYHQLSKRQKRSQNYRMSRGQSEAPSRPASPLRTTLTPIVPTTSTTTSPAVQSSKPNRTIQKPIVPNSPCMTPTPIILTSLTNRTAQAPIVPQSPCMMPAPVIPTPFAALSKLTKMTPVTGPSNPTRRPKSLMGSQPPSRTGKHTTYDINKDPKYLAYLKKVCPDKLPGVDS